MIHADGRVFRFFTAAAAADFSALRATGLLDRLVQSGAVVQSTLAEPASLPQTLTLPPGSLVVEHPRLPLISYAYEWPFEMLRAAAVRHLEVMEQALAAGFTLKDATPYNIQFVGPRPLLVDVASFERYQEGQHWAGYSQFCRAFLNPLLLQSITGVPFQPWLRYSLDGIAPEQLSPLLSLRRKLRPAVFVHVVLQAWLNRRLSSRSQAVEGAKARRISREATLSLAGGLRKVAAGLRRKPSRSAWIDYESQLPYTAEATRQKERFVEAALAALKPEIVWDLGCNRGHYSIIAAAHARHVVAMDSDEATVGALYERVRDSHPNVLPLVMDLMNPSPDQGWAQRERPGLAARGPAELALCLALLHHLRIGGNVPLDRIAEWLAGVARAAIVEFVPKTDPMVQTLLRTRPDVYPDYERAACEEALTRHFRIDDVCPLRGSERVLYRISRG